MHTILHPISFLEDILLRPGAWDQLTTMIWERFNLPFRRNGHEEDGPPSEDVEKWSGKGN